MWKLEGVGECLDTGSFMVAYGWQSEKVVLFPIMSSCILLVQEAEGSTDIVSPQEDVLLPHVRSECRRESGEPLTWADWKTQMEAL